MTRRPLLLSLVTVVLAACAESPVVEPSTEGLAARAVSAARGGASQSRPAGGTCTLVGRMLLPPLPGQPANVTRCQTEWVCQLKHMGRTTLTTIDAGAPGSTVTGTAVFTAANGDQLFTTILGTATFPDANGIVTFRGTDTVTGGTGRFSGATGLLAKTARVSVRVLSGTYEFDGTLSYGSRAAGAPRLASGRRTTDQAATRVSRRSISRLMAA